MVHRDALEWFPFVFLQSPMRCLVRLLSDPGNRTGAFRYANLVAPGGSGSKARRIQRQPVLAMTAVPGSGGGLDELEADIHATLITVSRSKPRLRPASGLSRWFPAGRKVIFLHGYFLH